MASLNDYTWAEISSIAGSGKASSTFALGDTKDITLTTGEVITVRIIGFDHDDTTDGSGKAPITFEMANLLATKYAMNDTGTNAGGWASTIMRTRLQPGGEIYETLPDEVKIVISPVDKTTGTDRENKNRLGITSDFCFLLSYTEIAGNTGSEYVPIEGIQYEYYRENTASVRIKKLSNGEGSAEYWYARSFTTANDSNFINIGTNGSPNYASNALAKIGVSFAFCVDGANSPTLPDLTPADFLRWFSLGQAVRRGAVKQEWETLFEGTVTKSTGYQVVPWPWDEFGTNRLSVGDVIRVTVGGTVEQYTVEPYKYEGFVTAGNQWLEMETGEDNGGNFYCWEYRRGLRAFIRNWDYTDPLNPTQTLKIERLVTT